MKTRDNTYSNTTEVLSFELTNTDINPRNTTGSLWFDNFTVDNEYINTTETLHYRARLVNKDIPQYVIIIDLFDYFGGIY